MLGLLIFTGLGIAGGASYISTLLAEKDAKNKAIEKSKRFWTDSKGRQINIVTNRPMTIREVIGDPPIKEIKRKELCYCVYDNRKTSIIDIEFHDVKPLTIRKNYEDAVDYVEKNFKDEKQYYEIKEIWM